MGLSQCNKFLKCSLIIYNIVLMLVGLGVCGLGVFVWVWRVEGNGAVGAWAVGAWGGALALAGALGTGGAACEARGVLVLSLVLACACAATEGAAFWWGASHTKELRLALHQRLRTALTEEYGTDPAKDQLFDAVQSGLQCCGLDGPSDWLRSSWSLSREDGSTVAPNEPDSPLDLTVGASLQPYWVPASCCKSPEWESSCESGVRVSGASLSQLGLWGGGCSDRISASLSRLARAPLLATAALALLHLVTIALTMLSLLTPQHTYNYKA